MQIRSIVQAGLVHGVIVLGVGLGVRPFTVTERPQVQLAMQLDGPAQEILEDPEIVEFVAEEAVPEPDFEEVEISEAPLEELRPTEFAEQAPPEREIEPRFAVPPRLRPSPDLLVEIRRPAPVKPVPAQPAEAEVRSVPADSPAEVMDDCNKKPLYPASARRRGLEADVVLMVTVSPEGEVCEVGLLKSAGLTRAHKDMNRSAIAAVVRWRYRPAMRNGVAVEARIKVPVRFRIRR